MLPIQRALQRINAANGIGPGPEARFSAVNIVWIVFGFLLLLMALLGSLLPADT